MNAEMSDLRLTLSQTQEQRLLRIVTVAYGYSLTNVPTPGVKDPATPFTGEIDILGDDVFTDDLLVEGVDRHETLCEPNATVRVDRSLIVAQALLDEDIGDDEIKLRISISRDNNHCADSMTPIVKGKF